MKRPANEGPLSLLALVPERYRYGMKEDLHIRVSEDIAQRVRAYAEQRGISLAAAVSVLLQRALEES